MRKKTLKQPKWTPSNLLLKDKMDQIIHIYAVLLTMAITVIGFFLKGQVSKIKELEEKINQHLIEDAILQTKLMEKLDHLQKSFDEFHAVVLDFMKHVSLGQMSISNFEMPQENPGPLEDWAEKKPINPKNWTKK
jgi:hypothetical protein